MQMSILERKEKELANREAEIEKERIYSEKNVATRSWSLGATWNGIDTWKKRYSSHKD